VVFAPFVPQTRPSLCGRAGRRATGKRPGHAVGFLPTGSAGGGRQPSLRASCPKHGAGQPGFRPTCCRHPADRAAGAHEEVGTNATSRTSSSLVRRWWGWFAR